MHSDRSIDTDKARVQRDVRDLSSGPRCFAGSTEVFGIPLRKDSCCRGRERVLEVNAKWAQNEQLLTRIVKILF